MIRLSGRALGEFTQEDIDNAITLVNAAASAAKGSQDQGVAQKKIVGAALTAMAMIPGLQVGAAVFGAVMGITYWITGMYPAQGVFCPPCMEAEVGAPVLQVWQDTVAFVQKVWDESLARSGKPARPFRIAREFLQPQGEEFAGTIGILPQYYGEGHVESAEDALLLWLAGATNGWNTDWGRWWDSSDTEGYAEMKFGQRSGRVEDINSDPCNANLCSNGPLGLQSGGWPRKCNKGCMQKHQDGLKEFYAFRLDALKRAVPAVLAAIGVQQAVDASPKLDIVALIKTALPALKVAPKVVASKLTLPGMVLAPKTAPVRASFAFPIAAAVAKTPPNALVTWAKGLPQVTWIAVGAAVLIAIVGGGYWYYRRQA